MLLFTTITLSITSLILLYFLVKKNKQLTELQVKHKVTLNFADKLSKKLLRIANANHLEAQSNGQAEKPTHKKTRRSRKKKSPKTNNSGSNKA